MKKTAAWFSRHQPTAEQITDASRLGYIIIGIDAGMKAGAVNMADPSDVWAAIDHCKGAVVFGVFPSPLRAAWRAAYTQAPTEVWEAWNVTRTAEGGKPTFCHKEWCRTA